MIPSTSLSIFFFNDTATTEIYTLSLHDALPISRSCPGACRKPQRAARLAVARIGARVGRAGRRRDAVCGSGAVALAARSDDLLLQFTRRDGASHRRAVRARDRAFDAVIARKSPAHADVAYACRGAGALGTPCGGARDDGPAAGARAGADCQRAARALSGARQPACRAFHRRIAYGRTARVAARCRDGDARRDRQEGGDLHHRWHFTEENEREDGADHG